MIRRSLLAAAFALLASAALHAAPVPKGASKPRPKPTVFNDVQMGELFTCDGHAMRRIPPWPAGEMVINATDVNGECWGAFVDHQPVNY